MLLTLKGYRLRDRNWSGAGGELDLVMERGGMVVFVEVKARRDDAFGGALAAIDAAKTRSIERAAAAYLSQNGLWSRPSRFDVVSVERRTGPPWLRVRHIRDAFRSRTGPVA